MDGTLLCMRLTFRVIRALDIKPKRVFVARDSETILGACLKQAKYFNEYFCNRIGETWDNQSTVEEHSPIDQKGEWYHVTSCYKYWIGSGRTR